MFMFTRKLTLESAENESVFLFGARQTGKSTLIKQKFPEARYYDLLKSDVLNACSERLGCFERNLTYVRPTN